MKPTQNVISNLEESSADASVVSSFPSFALTIVVPKLCETAGEKFGGYKFTKVVNAENAEIDDICVIRDGDHLFLLQNEVETMGKDVS